MKGQFDREVDAMYVCLDDSRIMESEEVKPGVVLDFNEKNQVVGVEILDAGKRVAEASLKQMHFEVA
jgi:uncharacterized protein YuzE